MRGHQIRTEGKIDKYLYRGKLSQHFTTPLPPENVILSANSYFLKSGWGTTEQTPTHAVYKGGNIGATIPWIVFIIFLIPGVLFLIIGIIAIIATYTFIYIFIAIILLIISGISFSQVPKREIRISVTQTSPNVTNIALEIVASPSEQKYALAFSDFLKTSGDQITLQSAQQIPPQPVSKPAPISQQVQDPELRTQQDQSSNSKKSPSEISSEKVQDTTTSTAKDPVDSNQLEKEEGKFCVMCGTPVKGAFCGKCGYKHKHQKGER